MWFGGDGEAHNVQVWQQATGAVIEHKAALQLLRTELQVVQTQVVLHQRQRVDVLYAWLHWTTR